MGLTTFFGGGDGDFETRGPRQAGQPNSDKDLQTIITGPEDLANSRRDFKIGTACTLGGFTIAGFMAYAGLEVSKIEHPVARVLGVAIAIGSLVPALALHTLSCYFYTPPSRREAWKEQWPHSFYVRLARYFT